MTEIRNFFANLFISRYPPSGGTAATPFARPSSTSKEENGGAPTLGGRVVSDTVTLSGSGHKIVNLARGQELAAEIRTAPVDKDFVANLFKAQQDILRIGRLFTETIKAAFQPRK